MTRPRYMVTDAEVLDGYRLRLRFEDRTEGTVDLSDLVSRGGVFTALQDPKVFRRALADAEAGTVVWPNEVDVAPEELYRRVHEKVRHDSGALKVSRPNKAPRRPSATRSRRRTPASARGGR